MKLQTVCLKLCAIPCLIVPAYSFTPRGMVCTRTLQPLGHVGGGMVNMLSSYCIPTQGTAAAAVARAASELERTCTASAGPWGAAVPAPSPTHALTGGWQACCCLDLPITVIQGIFGLFGCRTEINIARVPAYENANCLPAIAHHIPFNLSCVFTYPARVGLHTHAAALVPRGGRMADMLSSY